jgi:hypothetical protein
MKTIGALAASAALTLAGRGAATTPGTSHNAKVIGTAQQAVASEQSIQERFLKLPDARLDDTGLVEYLAPGEDPADLTADGGCTVNVILTTPEAVSTYQGDSWLVLNPAGTAGVKVVGTDAAQAVCLQVAADTMKNVK